MSGPDNNFDWDSLTFSLTKTEKMYVAECNQGDAWSPGNILPYGNLSIDPAAGVLNYGQGIFEGMKAQRTANNRVILFRPEENARRFQRGAARLGMPPVPESMFIDAVEQVVAANSSWIPPSGRGALYIRPVLWGTGPIMGVAPAPSYTFCVFATPVGPYFKGGLSAIDLLISEENHRAAPGGSGGVKAIGNYAPGMMPSKNAKKQGFAEVIYLDAVEHKYIEEVGAANYFCIKDNVLYTPELTGTILPGITRESIIMLARHRGYEVNETQVSAEFAMTADESFCCGTAAVISPIASITQGENKKVFGVGGVGVITRELYDALTNLQTEINEDPFGWLHEVNLNLALNISNE
ncbi:MAG: branched-chain amino acid aminotransferase [Euryarchaeota archaeon]|jgi:branched-chain amino acid aminotransferase|nr:branched-chain amino acid aminotransferase [Euryarchaeota archaeon]MBT3970753.1 branched-chain amino acid aminotransferase [Euryarchaeota archaeon]MBT4407568.1 branched-chain amino acid aminotransferase [Euryarchaeota archaeon]MBT6645446.1 branched-chain amino acid aminotransferase [Euryarchaeota archaeon]